MFRSNSLSLRTLALAGAVLVMAALPAFADGRGGGGRGGNSGGGRGGYSGGGRGGYGGYGGYRGGDFGRGGFYPGIGIGFGLGYGSGYGSGYRYGGYGYDSPYYGNSVIIGSSPYVSGYYSPPDVTVVPSNYETPVAADTTATVKVLVPADAQVWFDGNPTSQTGEVRTYGTPPLDPNKAFHYDVRARWSENGRVVDQTRRVEVRAGQRQDVDFSRGEPIGAPVKP
jgi:uncharacterized protein (TIGR03000 family)